MSQAGGTAEGPRGRDATTILVMLLALAIFLMALDRGNFATAAPLLKDELNLTNTQVGILISAFFWTYVPGHFFSGWLAERLDAYRTLALGLGLWSVATLLTGFAHGFAIILILRLMLGLGESAGFPASSKLLALNIPGERLASANATVGVGLMLGNGAGTLLGGLLIVTFGWRALFLVFGVLSLLWLVPWVTFRRPEPILPEVECAPGTDPSPSFAELFSRRELWGCALGQFCTNYPYFLVLSWLPLYLVKQHGYSITQMAWIGGAVYLLSAMFSVIGGRLADDWIRRGASVNKVRKTMMLVSASIALLCMLACATGASATVAVGALFVYSIANGLGAFSVFSIGQTLAGPRASGKWMGAQNGIAGLSGVVGPLVTGWLIDRTGDYRAAFVVAAAIVACGIAFWGLVVRKIERIGWK